MALSNATPAGTAPVTLTDTFSPDRDSYTAIVPAEVTSVTVTPKTDLSEPNVIVIEVAGGANSKTYEVHIFHRDPVSFTASGRYCAMAA